MIKPFLLGELVNKNARLFKDKEAFIFADTTKGRVTARITFQEFNERCNRVANMLKGIGVAEGDRVAVLDHDTIPRAEIEFGAFIIGAVLVPINWRLAPDEMIWILQNSDPKVFIVGEKFRQQTETLSKALPSVSHFISIGSEIETYASYDHLTASATAGPPPYPNITEDTLAMIIYTAGSTGRPKGVMISHRNFLTICAGGHASMNLAYGDISFITSPTFHSGGHAGFLANFYLGNTMILLERFDPRFVLEVIEKERVTFFLMVPTMLQMISEVPGIEKYDLKSLRSVNYGSSSMSKTLLMKLFDIFHEDLQFSQTLAATESSGWCETQLLPQDHILDGTPEVMKKKEKRLLSAGIPAPNVMIKIADENGNEVPAGEPGELFIRGANIMKGYWRNPEATKEAFVDGWYRQPDICKMDEDGYIYLLERKNNMIISGAENIYPAEVEEVLLKHPAISQAAVIGVPHKKWGETVKAIVTLKKGAIATEEEIIAFSKERLAGYKKPTSVDIIEEMPLIGPGKIDKQSLRSPYWRNKERHSD